MQMCDFLSQTNPFFKNHKNLVLYELKFSRWFYFREFREPNPREFFFFFFFFLISTSIYVYL